jgi:hypothetical protein
MRRGIRRRLGQLLLLMVALPVAGWALERLATRVEERRSGSAASRWLRTGADWVGGAGRGPLARRLRASR